MAYDPHRILRNKNKDIEEPLQYMGEALDECVNYGLYLTDWIRSKYKGDEHSTPIITTFIHFIDCIDSMSSLVKVGQASGVKHLLRPLLESSLAFSYLISVPKHKGTIAYEVSYIRKQISNRKLFDENEEKGQEFLTKLDKQFPDVKKQLQLNSTYGSEHALAFLERPEVKEVNTEWKRTKRKNKGVPNWYSLYDGPKDLTALAKIFDMDIMKQIIYGELSMHSHGSNSLNTIIPVPDENDKLVGITLGVRSAKGIQQEIVWALNIVLVTFRRSFDIIFPMRQKRFTNWYLDYMRDKYINIVSNELFTITPTLEE